MTLLSSLDTGTSAPRAPGAVLPETLAATQGTASSGAAQSFALLMSEGTTPAFLSPTATGAAAQSSPEGSPDTAAEAAIDGLPDMIARLLQPIADSGAPGMNPAQDGGQAQLTEAPATTDAPMELTETDLPDLSELSDLSDMSDLQIQPDLLGATDSPDATLPATQDPLPAPEDAPGDTTPTDAAEPSVTTDPALPPPAPVLSALVPTEPVAAHSATEPPPQPKGDGLGIDPAAKPAATTGAAKPMPAPATPEPVPPTQPDIAAKAAEATLPPVEAAAPAPEAPRPVAVTVSQAPAAQTGQTPAASPALPILQTQRPDWPLDLAERLIEGASLRSLGTGGLMEIRLDPDTLGPVTLRLEVADGTANVAIVTQTPEAARLFTDNQQRLADALARAGLDLGQHSAGTDARGGQQGRERPDGARPGTGPTDTQQPEAPVRAATRDRRVDLIA